MIIGKVKPDNRVVRKMVVDKNSGARLNLIAYIRGRRALGADV